MANRSLSAIAPLVLSAALAIGGCGDAAKPPTAQGAKEMRIAALKKQAEGGNSGAQSDLGLMYSQGDGVPKDLAKAAEWFQKAAAQGHLDAQGHLGAMYYRGEGVLKDVDKAMEWFQKAAAQGDELAQLRLGLMYERGEGVPKDAAKAVQWYQKAAAQGNAHAQYNLAMSYSNGSGVAKDAVLAYSWRKLAASSGLGETSELRSSSSLLTPAQRAEAERLSSRWQRGHILARENG